MKKIILLSLLVISVVFGKSVEEIQNEWQQRIIEKIKKQGEIFWQNEEANRLAQHCQGGNGDKGACKRIIDLQDKACQNGLAGACSALAVSYLQGNEQFDIKVDENKAKSYADRVCALDATFCVNVALHFGKKDTLLVALGYAERACEMGKAVGCGLAFEWYRDGGKDIAKNPKMARYYKNKLCDMGAKDFCK